MDFTKRVKPGDNISRPQNTGFTSNRENKPVQQRLAPYTPLQFEEENLEPVQGQMPEDSELNLKNLRKEFNEMREKQEFMGLNEDLIKEFRNILNQGRKPILLDGSLF